MVSISMTNHSRDLVFSHSMNYVHKVDCLRKSRNIDTFFHEIFNFSCHRLGKLLAYCTESVVYLMEMRI